MEKKVKSESKKFEEEGGLWKLKTTIENKLGDMKFDIVVGNPPYSGNLHLKIINTVINHLTEDGVASFIHPARWLQDPLAEYKKGSDKIKFKNIVDRLEDVKVIDHEISTNIFKISYNGELMISYISGKIQKKNITIYSDLFNESFDIVCSYAKNNNLLKYVEKDKIDGWRCDIKEMCPIISIPGRNDEWARTSCVKVIPNVAVFLDGKDKDGRDWTTVRAKGIASKKEGTPFPNSIKFNDEETALNFQKSCNTNFYKNWIQMVKLDMHTPLKFLPWMEDYSHPWTDEDYCKFFGNLGMSEECQKWMCRDVYDYRIKDFISYETF